MTLHDYLKTSLRQFYLEAKDIFAHKDRLRTAWGKSLTTFSGGDIAPYETVTVKVRGAENIDDDMQSTSVEGGTLIVETFVPATCETGKITKDIPADGIVTLKIPYGTHYAVHSEVDGLGASFTLTYTASQASREVRLWNLSLGVWSFGYVFYGSEEDDFQTHLSPLISLSDDPAEDVDPSWDLGDCDYYEVYSTYYCLVSTNKSSFLVAPPDYITQNIIWSERNYGRNVPGLEEFWETAGHDWGKATELATADFSGALNTDKILTALPDAPAAAFAATTTDWRVQSYLPSAGELYLIYQNKAEIEGLLGNLIPIKYYWSSSAFSDLYAWIVTMYDGNGSNNNKHSKSDVLAVSAFSYIYD